jgi:hypothetical protein
MKGPRGELIPKDPSLQIEAMQVRLRPEYCVRRSKEDTFNLAHEWTALMKSAGIKATAYPQRYDLIGLTTQTKMAMIDVLSFIKDRPQTKLIEWPPGTRHEPSDTGRRTYMRSPEYAAAEAKKAEAKQAKAEVKKAQAPPAAAKSEL